MQEVAALCDRVVIIGAGPRARAGLAARDLASAAAAATLEEAFLEVLGDGRGPRLMRALLTVFAQGIPREPARPAHAPVGAAVRSAVRAHPVRRDGVAHAQSKRDRIGRAARDHGLGRRARARISCAISNRKACSCTSRRLTEAAARARGAQRAAPVVLIVPAEYRGAIRGGDAGAACSLVADSSDSQTRKSADRLRALLASYGSGIAQLRLQIRGVEPAAGDAGRGQRYRCGDPGRAARSWCSAS